MTVFQCLPSYKPIATLKVIGSVREFGCRILLDLEDSIQDVIDPDATIYLKEQARIDLLKICSSLPNQQFDIRINKANTTARADDELLLRGISNISSIFIPKVESAAELEEFSERFDHRYKLNIIIETLNGINKLEEILNSKVAHKIEYVFFGNYDYHLDANIYPVQEQFSRTYWDIVRPIIKQVERKQLRYGNSSYARIGDLRTLNFIVNQLNTYCKQPYAVISLHRRQTALFNSSSYYNDDTITTTYENEKELQNEFVHKKLKGRSFALVDENNRIVTPHEYLLLKSRNG